MTVTLQGSFLFLVAQKKSVLEPSPLPHPRPPFLARVLSLPPPSGSSYAPLQPLASVLTPSLSIKKPSLLARFKLPDLKSSSPEGVRHRFYLAVSRFSICFKTDFLPFIILSEYSVKAFLDNSGRGKWVSQADTGTRAPSSSPHSRDKPSQQVFLLSH